MYKYDYLVYLLAIILGGAGAWVIKCCGYRFGLMDYPDERSSHSSPTPKGGGIGILAAFVFTSLFLRIPLYFWLPATFIGLLSFGVDRLDFSPALRLALQFFAAITLLAAINQLHLNKISGLLLIATLAVFAIGTANLYNFMDGINGIAALTGIVGFGFLALSIFLSDSFGSFAVLSTGISLSCLGFLPFNMPKAKVFMGDVGSVLLGFVFAVMVVVVSKNFLDFVSLTSFLFPFYADELTTMTVRIRDGENLMRPHRRHLYQILANEKGISHWKISLGYGLSQLVVGASTLFVKCYGNVIVLLVLASYCVVFIVASFNVRKNVTNRKGIDVKEKIRHTF